VEAQSKAPDAKPAEESKPIIATWRYPFYKYGEVFDLQYDRPHLWFALGVRGSGKSSFCERVAEQYLLQGAAVFDIFGAMDSEGLAWLRSKYRDRQILLLKGETTEVQSEYKVKNASEFTLQDLEDYDIIISANALYVDRDDEYVNMDSLMGKLYKRAKSYYRKKACVLVREASEIFYARLKVSDSQHDAKARFIMTLKESRHGGIALVADNNRFKSLEAEVRSYSDYIIFKALGEEPLQKEWRWIYADYYGDVHAGRLQHLPVDCFLLKTKNGDLAVGKFDVPEWHLEEGGYYQMMKQIGIEITQRERPRAVRGMGRELTEEEHASIIALYISKEVGGMVKIAKHVGRAPLTVQSAILKHNSAVSSSGFCPVCRQVGSPNDTHIAEKLFTE
jgi:hypothetical protein